MALLSSLNQIAGLESIAMSQEFMPEFFKLVLGTLSLPINLPGTNYHRGFQVNCPFPYVAIHKSMLLQLQLIYMYLSNRYDTGKKEHRKDADTTRG